MCETLDAMFTMYDGHSGSDYVGEWADCIAEASVKWSHLTIAERKRYTNAEEGAYYCVVDCETMMTIWDVTDLIGDEAMDCDRYGFDISKSGEKI